MTSTSTVAADRGPRPAAASAVHRFAPTAVSLGLAALAEAIAQRTATVAVVGLGHVGVPQLVAAGTEGFRLIGVDYDAVVHAAPVVFEASGVTRRRRVDHAVPL